jgi:hypothetical protein
MVGGRHEPALPLAADRVKAMWQLPGEKSSNLVAVTYTQSLSSRLVPIHGLSYWKPSTVLPEVKVVDEPSSATTGPFHVRPSSSEKLTRMSRSTVNVFGPASNLMSM